MKKLHFKVIVLAVSLAFSAGAMAQNMSKTEYQASKDKISAEYKAAREACASLAGNPKDVCVAQAKGNEKIAQAELDAGYKPSPRVTILVASIEPRTRGRR